MGLGGIQVELHEAIRGLVQDLLDEAATIKPNTFGSLHATLEFENGFPVFATVTKSRKKKLTTARK